jgi:hypothetical protein
MMLERHEQTQRMPTNRSNSANIDDFSALRERRIVCLLDSVDKVVKQPRKAKKETPHL